MHLIHPGEVSRIQAGLKSPGTAMRAEANFKFLVRVLDYGRIIVEPNTEKLKLETFDEMGEFMRTPSNTGIVAFSALYLHINRFRACRSPGTVSFLGDVQHLALGGAWATINPCTQYWNGYCLAIPFPHPAVNIRAVLVALNFAQFDCLKRVKGSIGDCESWTGDVVGLSRRRNDVVRKLHEAGRWILIAEIVKCESSIENRFPQAPDTDNDATPQARNPETVPVGVKNAVIFPDHQVAARSREESALDKQVEGVARTRSPSESSSPSRHSASGQVHAVEDHERDTVPSTPAPQPA